MWQCIHRLGSPKTCYKICGYVMPVAAWLFLSFLSLGLYYGLDVAPPDYQQGQVYRILFIHVPCAVLSMSIYFMMAVAAGLFLIWKLKVADMVAKICAPLGALFTALALLTGSIWGKPTWGTWWIWDARLTSELILLFIYFGIMALRSAIPSQTYASQASAIFILIGVVNLPIIHYSVVWWHTLHQGATLLKLAKPSISMSMLKPLLMMFVAFFSYFVWQLSWQLRLEIRTREAGASWLRIKKQEQMV